ncbi:Protein kinase protein rad53 [Teratosphaeriaceae sp. CCFEE 6253]|nr:Protein kinase protein rad53 [Teratosphaeriaceae sp. CCFEE 6253]
MERPPDKSEGQYSQQLSQEPTQCTQGAMDPRRTGRNNSAAFKIVATTAERSPHNVLQNDGFADYDDGLTQSVLEEQETFILDGGTASPPAMDLALRLTTEVINPTLGFVFGRNHKMCDIVLAADTYKRVSNMHFSIFTNTSGVLMLQDMSTNGTMVDDVVLKGKNEEGPQTRMLVPGSIIQVLSPKPEEIVKFVVRIPPREGFEQQYEAKFERYMRRATLAQAVQAKQDNLLVKRLGLGEANTHSASSYKAPVIHSQYGMHWTGGERYNVVGMIGKGAFATVYQLATKLDGKLFAAKELEKRKFMKNGVLDQKLDNEMQIMKAISHPNIVQYVDYQDHASHLYIVMEFVPCGDLQQYLKQKGALGEPLGEKVAWQVLRALDYLHGKKITHRDIKPDNILIANMHPAMFTVKLSDFGLSKVVPDNDTFLKTFCGTLLYCAPEVFPHYDAHAAARGQKRTRRGQAQPPNKFFHSYSQSVDVWSFGAVLWYSLCLKPPFEGVADKDGRGMFDKIMMTPLDYTDLLQQSISYPAIELLLNMLNTDPASRPLPAECLRHEWLAEIVDAVTQPGQERAAGIFPIEEDEEFVFQFSQQPKPLELWKGNIRLPRPVTHQTHLPEAAAQTHLAQLSLGEQGVGTRSQDSDYDEASIHSGSMDFFDPRQSKRFKSEAFAFREQAADLPDSSPELLHESIRIFHQPETATTPQKEMAGPRKLFGEISQSAFDSPETLGARATNVNDSHASSYNRSRESSGSALQAQQIAMREAAAIASPSLLGAESLMRDVHMDSPHGSADSPVAELNEPTTPKTPATGNGSQAGQSRDASRLAEDVTPKQAQQSRFNRQITCIDIPAPFWYDPLDESTHNLDYASKQSGHDYNANPSFIGNGVSLPATMSGSSTERDADDRGGDTDVEVDAGTLPVTTDAGFVKPPPRVGRLVTTPDSFAQITLNLTDRQSSWGRAPTNTHVYPDKLDTRIAKRAVVIYFHAPGMFDLPDGGDWTKLPGLHCGIYTESTAGVWVNGVALRKGEAQKAVHFGRLFTGDEVTVCKPGADGKAGLKFRCELFHGEAKGTRAEGVPRFVVETARPETRVRAKGKEREIGPALENIGP